jgi:phenylalanine-4-hydroxylase
MSKLAFLVAAAMGSIDVPPHLRKYVVNQNYDQYTVQDQAVWRFVLLQTYARLRHTAHAAYAVGFDAVGISVERIPRIAEINERLAQRSFQAVCVDGFIPPRAFQAFQARGVLPIASDIRTSKHLAYTPAPDIIHEAAGHAPFLAHPEYAHYLRRIGSVGEKAFTNAHDRAVYAAIFLLSELKESPSSTVLQLAQAEAEVTRLGALSDEPSEAARLARLYWWTVEYGLVGTPRDYRLFGAGLLSSLGEGHFCHEPSVRKLQLDASCVEIAYDITRPQPQLFVARNFEQLDRVLDEVSRSLGFRLGGHVALSRARASGEPACLELSTGAQLVGVVQVLHGDAAPDAIELSGACAIAFEFEVLAGWPRTDGYVLPLGWLDDGTSLDSIGPECLRRHTDRSGCLTLRLRSGAVITGRLVDTFERAGRVLGLWLADCVIQRDGRVLLRAATPYPLLLAERVVTAQAELPQGFYPATEFADTQVPKPRDFAPAERELIGLYEQALAVLRESFGSKVVPRFEVIHRALSERYPDEWLLRWNLLESLIKLGEGGALASSLEADLSRLEVHFAHREPIATGLAYLRGLGIASTAPRGGQEGRT